MIIQHFYDKTTGTLSYVLSDPLTNLCAIIDSVMDYDLESGQCATQSANKIIQYIQQKKLTVQWILETHIHADHLSAAQYLKKQLGGKIAIGANIQIILDYWGKIFDIVDDLKPGNFDILFKEGEIFKIGALEVKVLYTPGHTPVCTSYLIKKESAVFVGDTLFAPSRGTARADFPGGSAKILYQSIHKLYQLVDNTRVYICHDYPESDQEPYFMATIAEHKKNNSMVAEIISEEDYIKIRNKRDNTLAVPKLIFPAIQYNMRAGDFGKRHQNGHQFFHIPIDFFKK